MKTTIRETVQVRIDSIELAQVKAQSLYRALIEMAKRGETIPSDLFVAVDEICGAVNGLVNED